MIDARNLAYREEMEMKRVMRETERQLTAARNCEERGQGRRHGTSHRGAMRDRWRAGPLKGLGEQWKIRRNCSGTKKLCWLTRCIPSRESW